jgi:choline dehydrogenase-like flavoprotein
MFVVIVFCRSLILRSDGSIVPAIAIQFSFSVSTEGRKVNLLGGQAKPQYDVIVVGSGASGGWAAKRLCEAGLQVALLEAGRPQSDNNFSEHQAPFELKYRNMATQLLRKDRPIQSKFDVCNEFTATAKSRTPHPRENRLIGWGECAWWAGAQTCGGA